MYRLFIAGILAILLAGCETLNSKPGWLPASLTDDKPYLQQLSPDSASTSAESQKNEDDVRLKQSEALGLVHHPELEQLLNDELQRIREASGFTNVPGRVYIMAAPTMSALTTEAGNIYIPIGMLMDIQSMDEVDALLAHELAHAVLAHTDADLLKVIQKKGSAAYALANRLSMGSGQEEQVSRRIRNSVALYMATEKIISPTWTRKQESDADKLAVDFLVRAGRNVDGMTVLLSRLGQWDKVNVQLHEKDRPEQSMLVAAATSQFAENEWQALMIQALEPLGRQIEDSIAETGKTHLSPEERLADVKVYVRTHYRKVARPAIDRKTWKKTAHSTKSKQLANGVKHAHDAYRSVAQGNRAAARRALANSKYRGVANQTFYQVSLAMLAEDGGKMKEVISLAQSSSGNAYPSYRLQVMAQKAKAQQYGKLGETELRTLYDEFDHYGRPVEFYYDLIQLANASGSKGLELELIVRCQVAYFGDAAACSSKQAPATNSKEPGVVDGFLGLFGKKS